MKDFKERISAYKRVYIQIHNNPDADAIASGYGMQRLLRHWHIDADIIYFGKYLTKPNLTAMVKTFKIVLRNVSNAFEVEEDALVIILDGQAGAGNVKEFNAKNIMVIDHHIPENDYPYLYRDIQPRVGSCSTLVTRYLVENDVPLTEDVATSLYFGMLMDTDNFITKFTNLDKDMKDVLLGSYNQLIISRLIRSSLSLEDMQTLKEALGKLERYEEIVYSNVGDCDDNLLGHMSDIISDIEGVNIVVVYSERLDGYKLSVRSYHDYVSAEDIVKNLTKGIGSGGGHLNKAGGYISKNKFREKYTTMTFDSHVKMHTVDFWKTLKFFIEGQTDIMSIYGERNFLRARKRPYHIRYIYLGDYFEPGEIVYVKTLEGTASVPSHNHLIIGVKGEVYPISEDLFETRYEKVAGQNADALCDGFLDSYGIVLTSETKVVNISNEDILKKPIARSTALTEVKIIRVDNKIKIRTKWGDLSLRDKGYIIYVNKSNFYLCDEDIFHLTYQMID